MGAGLWSALFTALLNFQCILAVSIGGNEHTNQIGPAAVYAQPSAAAPAAPAVLCDKCRAVRAMALGARAGPASPPGAALRQLPADQPPQGKRKATLTINSFLPPSILPTLMKQIQSGASQILPFNNAVNDATKAAPSVQLPGGLAARMTYFPNQLEQSLSRQATAVQNATQTYPTSIFNSLYSAPGALFQTPAMQNPVISVPINNILSTESSIRQSPPSDPVIPAPNDKINQARIVFVQTNQQTPPAPNQPSTLLAPGSALSESGLSVPSSDVVPTTLQLQQGPKASLLKSMLPLLFGLQGRGCGCECGWHGGFPEPQIFGGYANRAKYGRLADRSRGRVDWDADGSAASSEEDSASDYSSEESAE